MTGTRAILATGLIAGVLVVGCGDDSSSNNNTNDNGNQNTPLTCGNGELEGIEECDDGAQNSDTVSDACRSNCTLPRCGDSVPDEGLGETCDVGWQNSDTEPDTCRTSCQLPSCGDGVIDANSGESCDDGNTVAGDGCDMGCAVEHGFACTGLPSVCSSQCGDGELASDEQCDDGNTSSDDGCSSSCQVEPFHACGQEPSQCSCVVFVNVDPAITARDGESWETAFDTPQPAIDAAAGLQVGGAQQCEVWVAQGTYNIHAGSASDTVLLTPLVGVYGGFLGTETQRSERDWEAQSTILDGANAAGTQRVYHVVTGASMATLDGFTVTGGEATGNGNNGNGGGMLNLNASLTVRNCVFQRNRANNGGGVYNAFSNIRLENVVFLENEAEGSGYGGGLYNNLGSSPEITQTSFLRNRAGRGGGIANQSAAPEIRNCVFFVNSSTNGGAIWNDKSQATLVSTVMLTNVSYTGGGAIYDNDTESETRIFNCTVAWNASVDLPIAGGFRVAGATSPYVVNSIFWGNYPNGISGLDVQNLRNSAVQDSAYSSSNGVVLSDPQLTHGPVAVDLVYTNGGTSTIVIGTPANHAVGDVIVLGGDGVARTITGIAGYNMSISPALPADAVRRTVFVNWGPGGTDFTADAHLLTGSPCIDTTLDYSAPFSDIDGVLRVDIPNVGNPGVLSDMGAYEFIP